MVPAIGSIAVAYTNAAYSRAAAFAAGSERTGAPYGQRAALRHMDTGIIIRGALHAVRAFEDDGGITQAGDAGPLIV